MIVNTNQTALDATFDISGSLAGFTTLLSQLTVGERIGFDDMPEVWEDVSDIGQTWTPDLQNVDIDVTVEVYNAEALNKAPYNTDILGLQEAIDWGEAILPTLFDETGWDEFELLEYETQEEDKYNVATNQTAIDVAFDLTGSIAGFTLLLDQLPSEDRIGFDDMPELWEDATEKDQTWTPNLQQQAFELSLPVYNLSALKKAEYNTDIAALAIPIAWGDDYLEGVITSGDWLTDSNDDWLVDEDDNFITT